jgi:predicted dehydrogenase
MAVVGLGFGRHLASTLANMPEAQLVAVCDRSPKHLAGGLEDFAAQYHCRAYRDYSAMLDAEQIDALVIATPPRGREALIEPAAQRGIAMFIEKPWATNLEHALELAALCKRTQAKVMLGFSFRFQPAIVKLRSLIDGEMGQGVLLNGEYIFNLNPPANGWLWDPQNGNGIFNENSGHLFDAVCFLLGRPVSVMAETINPFGAPSDHAAAITLRFANGAAAALTVGGIGADARLDFPRIDLVAMHGQAQLIGRHHIWEELRWALRGEKQLRSEVLPPEILSNTRYTNAFAHFLTCVRDGNSFAASVDDGVLAVAIAMAVQESARSGQKVMLNTI